MVARNRPSAFERSVFRSAVPGMRAMSVTVVLGAKPRPSITRGERATTRNVGVGSVVAGVGFVVAAA